MNPTYTKVDSVEYANGLFESGLVENSPHPTNQIYLKIEGNDHEDLVLDLRRDEVAVIMKILSTALFVVEMNDLTPNLKEK